MTTWQIAQPVAEPLLTTSTTTKYETPHVHHYDIDPTRHMYVYYILVPYIYTRIVPFYVHKIVIHMKLRLKISMLDDVATILGGAIVVQHTNGPSTTTGTLLTIKYGENLWIIHTLINISTELKKWGKNNRLKPYLNGEHRRYLKIKSSYCHSSCYGITFWLANKRQTSVQCL